MKNKNGAPNNEPKRTYFIKPSHAINETPLLCRDVVVRNKSRGIETSLAFDTNILIKIQKIVSAGNRQSDVERHGLKNLVRLLDVCPPESICISPGLAMSEIPPESVEGARFAYEKFCAKHLPRFVNTPNATNTTFESKIEKHGFDQLSTGMKAVLAVPYVSLLLMSLAEVEDVKAPLDRFSHFLDLLESDLGVLSAMIAEIAKYCFVHPPAQALETIEIRRRVRDNFLRTTNNKLPRTLEDAKAVAFNGACDLMLINSANILDSTGLDGVPQDAWLATQDKKLVRFCSVFHHVVVGREAGLFAVSSVLEDQRGNGAEYWSESHTNLVKRNLRRMVLGQVEQNSEEHIESVQIAYARLQDFFGVTLCAI